eukprot:1875039-Ditylum_brightwellii.AAC.1
MVTFTTYSGLKGIVLALLPATFLAATHQSDISPWQFQDVLDAQFLLDYSTLSQFIDDEMMVRDLEEKIGQDIEDERVRVLQRRRLVQEVWDSTISEAWQTALENHSTLYPYIVCHYGTKDVRGGDGKAEHISSFVHVGDGESMEVLLNRDEETCFQVMLDYNTAEVLMIEDGIAVTPLTGMMK